MGYRVKGTLKLPDGSPASNAEIEFISRKNFSPLLQELKSNILCGPTGDYDVTLEYGEYAVLVYPGGTYPAALGTIILATDTATGQDLPTLLQQAGWQPATPEYIQQISQWLAEASASASAASASELAAKVSENKAKESEIATESDRAEVAANAATVSLKHSEVLSSASQVSADASAAQSAKNTAVSASSSAQTSATSASEDAGKAVVAAAKAEQAAQTVVGALIDAGPYSASTGVLPTPVMSGSAKMSSIWKVTSNGVSGGIELGVGDSLVYTARDNSYYKIDNTESVSKVNNKTGVVVLNAEDVGAAPENAISASALPFPDVWLPLNDSLRLLAGFGDEIKVGDYTVAMQATLTRNSAATLINKSGVLVSAGVNEPRFEKEGFLIEGQSTNLVTTSEKWNASAIATGANAWVHSEKDSAGWITVTGGSDESGAEGSYRHFNRKEDIANSVATFSFDVKKTPGYIFEVRTLNTSGGDERGTITWVIGEDLGIVDIAGHTLEDKGDWLRISVTREFGDGTNVICRLYPFGSKKGSRGSLTYRRVQIETLPSATSYIPTSGSAVTRTADKLTIPRLNNDCAEWYSGPDQINQIFTADTIELVPPAGKSHLRNVRGFFTPLTAEQKAALK